MERRHIGFAIKALSNQLQRSMDCRTGNHEITGMQAGVLDFVFRNQSKGDIFQKDIEAEFNIRGSTATGILSLMEKNGLIIREPVNYDARLKKIVLTEKGIDIRNLKRKEIFVMEERLAKGLSEEDVDNFLRIIDTMMKNIES